MDRREADGGLQDRLGRDGALLLPSEVAALFRVDPKTVTRWAVQGRVTALVTPGGRRRFRSEDVRALLQASSMPAAAGRRTLD